MSHAVLKTFCIWPIAIATWVAVSFQTDMPPTCSLLTEVRHLKKCCWKLCRGAKWTTLQRQAGYWQTCNDELARCRMQIVNWKSADEHCAAGFSMQSLEGRQATYVLVLECRLSTGRMFLSATKPSRMYKACKIMWTNQRHLLGRRWWELSVEALGISKKWKWLKQVVILLNCQCCTFTAKICFSKSLDLATQKCLHISTQNHSRSYPTYDFLPRKKDEFLRFLWLPSFPSLSLSLSNIDNPFLQITISHQWDSFALLWQAFQSRNGIKIHSLSKSLQPGVEEHSFFRTRSQLELSLLEAIVTHTSGMQSSWLDIESSRTHHYCASPRSHCRWGKRGSEILISELWARTTSTCLHRNQVLELVLFRHVQGLQKVC